VKMLWGEQRGCGTFGAVQQLHRPALIGCCDDGVNAGARRVIHSDSVLFVTVRQSRALDALSFASGPVASTVGRCREFQCDD
jgi:hypothetical protein